MNWSPGGHPGLHGVNWLPGSHPGPYGVNRSTSDCPGPHGVNQSPGGHQGPHSVPELVRHHLSCSRAALIPGPQLVLLGHLCAVQAGCPQGQELLRARQGTRCRVRLPVFLHSVEFIECGNAEFEQIFGYGINTSVEVNCIKRALPPPNTRIPHAGKGPSLAHSR